jgi:hypothetical protein
MEKFEITTAANTTYSVVPLKDKPNAFEVRKGEEHCLFFMGSKGQWSTGDFAPPFVDFDIAEIGKLIEFQLKSSH